MAECSSSSNKWACSLCTYLNYETSLKCTVCHSSRDKILIIEEAVAAVSSNNNSSISYKTSPQNTSHEERWCCPSCTYFNCLRTKKCIQCLTDRPLRYGSDNSINQISKTIDNSNSKQSSVIISKALNKWTCLACTFDNWPNANRCTMCGIYKTNESIYSLDNAIKNNSDSCQEHEKNYFSSAQASRDDKMTEITHKMSSTNMKNLPYYGYAKSEHYTSALDIYLRRFVGNDHIESLFFKAAVSIEQRDIEMVNSVVNYLINEGNLQRRLNCFENRLLNSCAHFGNCFENGDSLIDIAKKCDSLDLVKLLKRVSPGEDKLPCSLNCTSRTRIWAKIAQLIVIRNGNFCAQFIAHPHNFNILKFPMESNELNLQVMKTILKPAPSIPPTYVFVDCFDTINCMANIVGRPANFLMKNRGGGDSLCDAIFQTMFGICDRFGLLQTAQKFTMLRSAHLFKSRWREQYFRLSRNCGLTLTEEDLDNDWEETLNADECLEPIHIWALAHVVCRPIIVVSMMNPLSVADLETIEIEKSEKPREYSNNSCEGIYLPVLWGSPPISRSPLIIAFHNGLFYAVIVSDGYYQRDQDIQRFLKIKRSKRSGENPFKFLTKSEMENSNFIGQFICLGVCSPETIAIRRDPHPFLYESLIFYGHWINALNCFDLENSTVEIKSTQLEQNMDQPLNLIRHICYNKFSIFTSKATSMLKHHCLNSPNLAETSVCIRKEPLDSEEEEEEEDEEEEEEDNESLVDEDAETETRNKLFHQ